MVYSVEEVDSLNDWDQDRELSELWAELRHAIIENAPIYEVQVYFDRFKRSLANSGFLTKHDREKIINSLSEILSNAQLDQFVSVRSQSQHKLDDIDFEDRDTMREYSNLWSEYE